jgi:hypothetical protein
MRVGAEGCGEHDDLVIALALACWRTKRMTHEQTAESGGARRLRIALEPTVRNANNAAGNSGRLGFCRRMCST